MRGRRDRVVPTGADPRLVNREAQAAEDALERTYAADVAFDHGRRFVQDTSLKLLGLEGLTDDAALEDRVIQMAVELLQRRVAEKAAATVGRGASVATGMTAAPTASTPRPRPKTASDVLSSLTLGAPTLGAPTLHSSPQRSARPTAPTTSEPGNRLDALKALLSSIPS